jgi:hypothetical protein
MTMKVLAAIVMAAIVAGCADERGYLTAEECWADRQCRREWRQETRAKAASRHGKRIVRVKHESGGASRGPDCRGLVVATGERAQSEDSAQTLALRSWRGQVQFKYGESYTSFEYAKDPRILCTPAGVDDTVGGKIGKKLFGVSHWRCELSGYPCRGRAETVEREQ